MRLANGIVLDKEKTFGVLKFSALRHEVRAENDDGSTSDEITRRNYDLKCSVQERMIQVSIPADIPVKDYPYNAEVELVNPVADTVANAMGIDLKEEVRKRDELLAGYLRQIEIQEEFIQKQKEMIEYLEKHISKITDIIRSV